MKTTNAKLLELRAMPIRGNALADGPAMKLADEIIRDADAQLATRLEAITILDKIVGNPIKPLYSAVDIVDYIKECDQ